MKRFTIAIAVAAIVTALAAMAFAQGENPSTTPATPAAEPAKPAAKSSTKSSASHAHATHHYDLNAATKEDLMKLPGITDELADKIIAARPYKAKSELESKKILSSKEYSKIHTMVMVKSPTMAGNTSK